MPDRGPCFKSIYPYLCQMRNSGRIFFSFLFLTAFLIPTVGETLHQISHANDFHCNEINAHHFHEAEHHCVICEFSFTSYYSDLYQPELSAIGLRLAAYSSETVITLFCIEQKTHFLRGPPVC